MLTSCLSDSHTFPACESAGWAPQKRDEVHERCCQEVSPAKFMLFLYLEIIHILKAKIMLFFDNPLYWVMPFLTLKRKSSLWLKLNGPKSQWIWQKNHLSLCNCNIRLFLLISLMLISMNITCAYRIQGKYATKSNKNFFNKNEEH